jgi:hypothetical protein
VQRLVISRMQARTYQERFADAAEIATQAMNGSASNGSADGTKREATPVA